MECKISNFWEYLLLQIKKPRFIQLTYLYYIGMAPPSTTTSVNSPRTNEVNFKRLLQKCEDVVKTAQVIKEPLDGARKRQLSKVCRLFEQCLQLVR